MIPRIDQGQDEQDAMLARLGRLLTGANAPSWVQERLQALEVLTRQRRCGEILDVGEDWSALLVAAGATDAQARLERERVRGAVLWALEPGDVLTVEGLAHRTGLPQGRLRDAIRDLVELGAVARLGRYWSICS